MNVAKRINTHNDTPNIVIINGNTGEVLDNGYVVETVENKERRRQFFERLRKGGAGGGRTRSFTNSDMDNLSEVLNEFTLAQSGYIFFLQSFISFNDGLLVNKDGTYMTYADMRIALSIPKSTFSELLSKMIEVGLIRKEISEYSGITRYYFNTRYHFKGSYNKRKVVKSYVTALRRSLGENRATDLGIIYRLLPYISMKYNAVCRNPYETDADEIRWLTYSEIADIVDVSVATIKRRLPAMRIDGENVFLSHRLGGGKTRHSVNPKIISRNEKEFSDEFQGLFKRGK